MCTGEEKEFCATCREFWTVDGPPRNYNPEKDGLWTEAKNNRLMFCDGGCGRLWHQNCYHYRIIYPGDDKAWKCDECQMKLDKEEAAEEAEEAQRASRLPRIKKVTKKGAVKDVTRVSGQAAPSLRIADPREGHLQAATWVDNHTRGGGEGSRKRRKVPGMIAHTHMPM